VGLERAISHECRALWLQGMRAERRPLRRPRRHQ
jgi:hypothetical protein